jgi:hypothetical protein
VRRRGGLDHAADAQGRVGVECSVNLSVVSVIFF